MSEIVTTDGVRIAYDVWGPREGTPVLLIQGLGMNARGWALQRGAFGRRHRCVAIDNRGTGPSDTPPGPYDLVRMASDAVEVLDAAGIERAHILGASMGGVIAQILGVMHPERVQSLVLSCTACRHHKWRRELLAEWAELAERLADVNRDRFAELLAALRDIVEAEEELAGVEPRRHTSRHVA
jgi:pimeloyl-ACP methyl ester carboxylesterase